MEKIVFSHTASKLDAVLVPISQGTQVTIVTEYGVRFLNLQPFFSICRAFIFWLCCKHLLRVLCKIEEVVFLICRCFFQFAAR